MTVFLEARPQCKIALVRPGTTPWMRWLNIDAAVRQGRHIFWHVKQCFYGTLHEDAYDTAQSRDAMQRLDGSTQYVQESTIVEVRHGIMQGIV